ncbi:MAG: hypothetical protein SOR61_03640 [Evtepia sp.]|uniref:hypothetical protein n=1 Tax=Evtepia sp. TaxID=2773933 RepID=UPI002A761C9E|nr:hypothetical protein [Evtepia sp.]MDY3014276.1 hypothetical protein [Evtepia sp.]
MRWTVAGSVFSAVLAGFFLLLWNLQVVQGAAYYEKSQRSIAEVVEVPAARGKLLDRNGKILARDQGVWTAQVEEDLSREDREALADLCHREGILWDGQGTIPEVSSTFMARESRRICKGSPLCWRPREWAAGPWPPMCWAGWDR